MKAALSKSEGNRKKTGFEKKSCTEIRVLNTHGLPNDSFGQGTVPKVRKAQRIYCMYLFGERTRNRKFAPKRQG